jgi:two-component system NarL family sensor kinase
MVTAPADRVMTATPAGTRSAAALVVAAVVEVLLWFVLSLSNGRTLGELLTEHEFNAAVVALSFGIDAFVVLRRRPRHPIGWLFALIAQLEGLSLLGTGYSAHLPELAGSAAAAWIGKLLWWPGLVAGTSLLTPLFPDGAVTRLRKILVWAGVVATVGSTVFIALSAELYPGNPTALGEPWSSRCATAAVVCLVLALAVGAVGAVLLAIRMWRATGLERRRLAWFFAGFAVVVLVTALPMGVVVQLLGTAFLPFALGMAILRYGLFDGDRLLNRTLVYGALSVLVAGTFGLGIGLVSSAVGGTTAGAVVAAVVIAIGLAPARDVVQRGVDRLLYGRRRDPYAVLTDLGRHVSGAVAPDEILVIVCRTLATALRLPYVAITLGADHVPAAIHGAPAGGAAGIPLVYAGAPVGRLDVDAAGRRQLDVADDRLLDAFAQQAGTAAHAAGLARELRLSHDRLASARDEERHRIRRDLHDQLAPALAGVALGIGAARRAVAPSDPRTGELLDKLRAEVRGSLDDVKLLVADLRPTTLERYGLLDALRRHAAAVSGETFEVSVAAGAPMPVLPSRVEVAAYRIALEAVANTSRHSGATACRISVGVSGDVLTLSVADNGTGLPFVRRQLGLGLRSMAERAAELGGSCVIGAAASRGTLIEATLPLVECGAGGELP